MVFRQGETGNIKLQGKEGTGEEALKGLIHSLSIKPSLSLKSSLTTIIIVEVSPTDGNFQTPLPQLQSTIEVECLLHLLTDKHKPLSSNGDQKSSWHSQCIYFTFQFPKNILHDIWTTKLLCHLRNVCLSIFLFQPMLMCLKIPHMATLLRHLNVKLSSTVPS